MFPEGRAVEFLVAAVVALIVVGPKDLPILLRKFGQFMAKVRSMAAEFRASFDELARQSELDELRKEVEAMRAAARQPADAAMQSIGLNDMRSEIEAGLYDPHETPQPHVGPLGESLEEPLPPPAEAAPEAKPKPKRKPRAKSKP